MTIMPLRFEFRILTEDGAEIASDWTTFDASSIDENGACEMVDMNTSSALRFVKRDAVRRVINNETEAA